MNTFRIVVVLLLALGAGYWLAQAGSLDPSGPPAPTMRTLLEIPPSWHKLILDPSRFEIVVGGGAALDHETGLVWERAPAFDALFDWYEAVEYCYHNVISARFGWRLPTIEELASLVDRTNQNPALPTGHPFTNVEKLEPYWTITTKPSFNKDTSFSYNVKMDFGSVSAIPKNTVDKPVWCVRGGHGYDYAGQ